MDAQHLTPADQQLLEKFRQPYAPSRDEYERFVGLKNRRLVKLHHFELVHLGELGDHMAPDTWIITAAGEDALSEFDREREQEAEEKRRYDVQRQQADLQNALSARQVRLVLIQTIIAAVSFIAGLICEHYVGLLGLLFRWLG